MRMTNKERAYQCLVELHSIGRVPSKEMVAKETGMKFSVVDQAFEELKDAGHIFRALNGIYEPTQMADDPAVTCSVLNALEAKLEVGDFELICSPRTARRIVLALGGYALVFGR